MKLKIFILMFCMILLIGNVSAIGWDNKLTYSENDLKVELINWFGWGTNYGSAELKSHNSVDQILEVPHGEEEVVIFYDLDFNETYPNGLGKVYFTDMKTNEEIERDYYFVEGILEDFEVDNYQEACELTLNGSTQCQNKIVGKKIAQRWTWKELETNDIPDKKIRIGLKTEVKEGDWIDAVWTIAGKKVEKHAEFVAGDSNTRSTTLVEQFVLGSQSTSAELGINITVGFENVFLTKVTTSPSTTADVVYLIDAFNGTVLTSETITSNNATFNNFLIGNNSYLILVGDVGSPWTVTRDDGLTGSFPIDMTEVSFTSGAQGTSFPYTTDSDRAWSIQSLDLAPSVLAIPVVTLVSPVNFFNTSNSQITFNGTVNFTAPDNVTLFIDDVGNETNSTGIIDHYQFTKIISEGIHTWNYQSCTVSGCANGTKRNFIIDQSSPIINITFPTETIDFHLLNTNISINWTLIELLPDTCILQFEGVNRTVTCGDNQTQINITNNENRTIIFYANDTFGNVNSSSRTWDYFIFENNQTFNVNVFEGNTETFSANVIIGSGNSISTVNLFYNGTSSVGSFSSSGDNYFLSKTLEIPEVSSETNITFIWNLQLSGGQSINITPHNQTISPLTLDDCSVNTVVLYNYTIVDEGNQTQLFNTSAELNINIRDTSRETFIANYSKLYTETNPFAVCLNLDFNSSIYSVDSVVRYESNDHVIEYYNILSSTLINTTIPINITLYDLASADSTEFKISFKGEDFVFVENALIFIDRQYIAENNTFKTVELPKTDSEGQTVGHFVRSDVVYNIRVVKDSVLLATFNNIIAFCQDFTIGDCQIVLVATPSSQSTFDYDSELGVIFDSVPTYSNTTNAVSFSYSTDDGTPKTVFLEVTRSDIFGNRTICNNTVTSSSGTLSCSVDPNIDETNLITKVYVDGKLAVLSNIVLDNASTYGNLAYTLWFFLTFIFILGFGTSKTEVLIGLVVSIIGAISLGLVRGDIVGIGSAGIWMIVIVLLGIWKLNKENPQ